MNRLIKATTPMFKMGSGKPPTRANNNWNFNKERITTIVTQASLLPPNNSDPFFIDYMLHLFKNDLDDYFAFEKEVKQQQKMLSASSLQAYRAKLEPLGIHLEVEILRAVVSGDNS